MKRIIYFISLLLIAIVAAEATPVAIIDIEKENGLKERPTGQESQDNIVSADFQDYIVMDAEFRSCIDVQRQEGGREDTIVINRTIKRPEDITVPTCIATDSVFKCAYITRSSTTQSEMRRSKRQSKK